MAAEDDHVEAIDFEGSIFRSSNFLPGPHAQNNQLDLKYEDFLKDRGLIPPATKSDKDFSSSDVVLKNQMDGSLSTFPGGDEVLRSYDTCVRGKAKGKGKLYRISEKVEMLKKRARVDAASPYANASSEETDFLTNSPSVVPACSNHSPETIRKRRALRSLSLYLSEKEFCEGSSDRSDSITKALAKFAVDGALDIDYNLLDKKSVFASFQALHFSSAAIRAHQRPDSPENILREKLSEEEILSLRIGEALDHEKALHANTLTRLQEAEANLEAARDSLRSLEAKINHMAARVAIHKEELNDVAIQYNLMARICMLLEPVEDRASWNVHDEINAFKLRFPKIDLKEWGVCCNGEDSSGEE